MSDIVAAVGDIAEERDEVSVHSLVEKFGDRSFAPFMLLVALVGFLPTGAVPGVPSLCAITIAMVAAQRVLGRKRIWLPQFIAQRTVRAEKLNEANDTLDWLAEKLDAIAKGRLKFFASELALRTVSALILLLCCLIPILEFVPFAAAGPFFAIAMLSLALIVRDGLVVLIGSLGSAVTLFYGASWLIA